MTELTAGGELSTGPIIQGDVFQEPSTSLAGGSLFILRLLEVDVSTNAFVCCVF